MVDEMGCGFRTVLGEILVLSFLAIGSVMNTMLRISLTSLPVNIACLRSFRNIDNVLLLHSNGCVPSSSLEFVSVRAYLFYTFGPKLGPTPTS
jgi:hypothetical protein